MSKLYLVDQENTSFVPQSADEAIILFNRLKRKNQVNWERVPELLQHCAQALNAAEHDRFCQWICNPCEIKPGKPGYFASLCDQDSRVTPNLPPDEDEEKVAFELSDRPSQDHSTPCDIPICNESWSTEAEPRTPEEPPKS